MTSPVFPTGWRFLDHNQRPHVNAKVWAERDGEPAENWLDPKLGTPGQRVRRTNLAGEVCNGSDDGKPRGFHLKPGDYLIRAETASGAPIIDYPVTIAEGGSVLVLQGAVQQMAVQPAHLGVTINADPRAATPLEVIERRANGAGQPAEIVIRGGSLNIAEAIRDLLRTVREGE